MHAKGYAGINDSLKIVILNRNPTHRGDGRHPFKGRIEWDRGCLSPF